MHATCQQSVLRSVLRSVEEEEGRGGGGEWAGEEGRRLRAGADGTMAPGSAKVEGELEGCLANCSAKCNQGG